MKVIKDRSKTNKGPEDWFTGDVYIDSILSPNETSDVSMGHVHFNPGTRTVWHTHPYGQTLYVTDGVGYIGRRGGKEEIRPGDIVHIEPDEAHWHGATGDNFMSHIAMSRVYEDGKPAEWQEAVSEEDYSA